MNVKVKTEIDRPDIVEEEHLEYLHDLRESGVCNMFGAAIYLEEEFFLTRKDARIILKYWMESFCK